jgi:NDP-sugar pyrophosphorylase family protein
MLYEKCPLFLFSLFSAQEERLKNAILASIAPWELRERLLNPFLGKKKCDLSSFSNVHFINSDSIYIEEGVSIAPGALIEGPCYIGEHVSIGHCAYIRKGTFLAKNVHIGHCSEISRSLFLQGAKAPHFNYVGDSVIGENVNLGAHATLANLRLDKKPIKLHFEGTTIATERIKMGSFVGDNASIACGVVLNPGTIVPKKSLIYPQQTTYGLFHGQT